MSTAIGNGAAQKPLTRRRAAHLHVVVLLATGAVVGCSSDIGGNGAGFVGGEAGVAVCPTISSNCPKSGPSYATDVAPILAAHCIGCHGPGGENAHKPLDSYDAATSAKVRTAGSLVGVCKMPPPPLPPLSAGDIQTLRCWYSQSNPAK